MTDTKTTESINSGNTSPVLPVGAYSPKEIEAKWTSLWFESNLFNLTVKEGQPFYSGALPPPNITGNLHMGHALNGTLQDVLFRYKRMRGYNVLWQPGTDHAGIATQMVVERELKKQGKSRYDLGRKAFIEQVWKWREQYGNSILNQYKRLGVSFAWDRIAFTMDESYVKAINKVFVQLFKDGLIYRGNRVVNWCPSCLTSLSDLEVQHEEQAGQIYIINYPLVDDDAKLSTKLNVATTRPETMFADVAIAVNPEDTRYKNYIGKKVILPLTKKQIPVIADSYVDKDFGTGILKITPAHDSNDFEVGQRHKLEMPIVIDEAGKLVHSSLVPDTYQGMDRFAARKKVAEDLAEQGFLVETKKHDNAIGLCERCSTVIEPRLSDQWYMSMTDLVKPAIKAVEDKRIVFIPERYSATYLDWMHNIRDWCISRQLWWGQRIPIWTCTKCGAIDAFEEPPLKCQKCGNTELEQDPDVLDTWFSAGLFPFVTLGWPNSSNEMANFYPTNILVTARDIINLWVSRMAFFSLKIVNKIPFKHVLIHPVIQTADGKRMSKSKGNAIDPIDMIDKYGADANRFWFTSIGLKGDQDVRFREDKLDEYKRFVNKLWNAGKFVISKVQTHISTLDLTSNSQILDHLNKIDQKNLTLADRWILSKYNRLLETLPLAYENYDYQILASELYQFTWNYFCDWYLEISKFKSDISSQKADFESQSEKILFKIFQGLLKAMHPIMPFVTDELSSQFNKLVPVYSVSKEESILSTAYPLADNQLINNDAEKQMDFIIQLVREVRNIRHIFDIPNATKIDLFFESNSIETKLVTSKLASDLANITAIDLNSTDIKSQFTPQSHISVTVSETTFFISPRLNIDIEKTSKKLTERKQSKDKEVLKIKQIFLNQDFMHKAPPEKVKALQSQLNDLETQIKHLETQLKVLN